MFVCGLSHVTHFSIVCKGKLQVFGYLHDYRDVIPFWADGRLPDQIFAKRAEEEEGERKKKMKTTTTKTSKISPVILVLRCL